VTLGVRSPGLLPRCPRHVLQLTYPPPGDDGGVALGLGSLASTTLMMSASRVSMSERSGSPISWGMTLNHFKRPPGGRQP